MLPLNILIFFDEYNNQSVLRNFSTGLHTNIGYIGPEGEMTEDYNLFSSYVFESHYATGVGLNRERSGWTGDLKPALHNIEKFAEALPERFGS